MDSTPATRVELRRSDAPAMPGPSGWPSRLIAVLIVLSSLYAALAAHPYRGLPEATLVAARAQDVCSVVVAAVLAGLAGRTTWRSHVIRLGLFAYVAYSYAVYLIGLPMNRIFLLYVALVSIAGAALLHGVGQLRLAAWPRQASRRLERGTGWFLVAVAASFTALWLSALLPYALGGPPARPQGPGGVAYPVFVLDLVVVLPCVAAVGVLLLRGRSMAGPLTVVVLVKIITLFTALWVGVVVGMVTGVTVHLAADAGPSLVMLAVCAVLVGRWLRVVTPDLGAAVDPSD